MGLQKGAAKTKDAAAAAAADETTTATTNKNEEEEEARSVVARARRGNRNARRPCDWKKNERNERHERQRRRREEKADVRENPIGRRATVRGGDARRSSVETRRRAPGCGEIVLYRRGRYRRELGQTSSDETTRGRVREQIAKFRRLFSERDRDGKHGDVRVSETVGKEREERRVHIFGRSWFTQREGEDAASVSLAESRGFPGTTFHGDVFVGAVQTEPQPMRSVDFTVKEMDSSASWLKLAPMENAEYAMSMKELEKAIQRKAGGGPGLQRMINMGGGGGDGDALPSGDGEGYRWEQTEDGEVEISVYVPENTSQDRFGRSFGPILRRERQNER